MKKYFIVLVYFGIIFFNNSFVYPEDNAELWITKNFTESVILKKEIKIEKRNVMQILDNYADIETAFAGGYVAAINAIKSSPEGRDWFYYINGIMADVGALEYFPKEGDVIWWDYHQWNYGVYPAALIGAYPQPFLISPVYIYVTKNLKKGAEELRESLHKYGVGGIKIEDFSAANVFDYPGNICLVVGRWEELRENKFIKEIYDNYKKTGFFARFEQNKIASLNTKGKIAHSFEEGAVIIAAKVGLSRDNPIWFITGTSDRAVNQACSLLAGRPEEIKFHSAVILAQEKIINIPSGK